VLVQRIESLPDLSALAVEWDRLIERSGYALPFSTFSWSATWWQHFAENRHSVRDRLAVRAIRDDRGQLVAVAPFMVTERPAAGPLRVRCLRFLGADPNITEIPGMVYLPEFERVAYSALMDDLQSCSKEWHWILWSGLKQDGIAAEIISRYQPIHWQREVPAYLLTLAPSWEEFRSGLPRNIKESLRKCYRSLERDRLTFHFVAIERTEELPSALSHFVRLHDARARMAGGIRHRNLFRSDNARQFLVDVCQAFARTGSVRVFALKIDDRIVAMRIGFICGDTLYLYYSGYDPAWSKYSVMTTLVAESIKYAIATGIRIINLSTGNDVSKTRWRPREVCYREGVQVSPSFDSRAAHAIYHSVANLRDWAVLWPIRAFFGHRAG
jgi:CelD/BcsL family acetyltransferase involved in cellulose biosynthesis